MKKINFKNTVSKVIFMTLPLMGGVGGGLLLSSCNDYLDVDAPSSYTEDFVFSQKSEVSRALNGVYAEALVNDLYGNAYQRTMILNSDVETTISSNDQHQHNTPTRLDCDDESGDVQKYWDASYKLIEYANRFITNLENSEIYADADAELYQMMGEAKCLRAMAYHDLVVLFGDVPFTFTSAANLEGHVIPVKNRTEIQTELINDLKAIAPKMSLASGVTAERCSKDFAYALIARIALTAGGYSLVPNTEDANSYGSMQRPANYKEFYQIARDYADSVMTKTQHSLGDSYSQVFIDECNYTVNSNGDVIFELPFAKEANGNTGYAQGPTYSDHEGETVSNWGKCDGGARLNAFYRFQFDDKDLRREFVNGLWYHSYATRSDGAMVDTTYIRNDYTVHNNKWSKLWTAEGNALGNKITGSTGINFPYMRYADVLLMFAEADNELNGGPTEKAVAAVKAVRNRAFKTADRAAKVEAYVDAAADKESFLKVVLDERKWELAGENSRWRDLVRNNKYAEELVYSFLRYWSAGYQNVSGMTGFEDAISEHDGKEYIDNLPERIYYHIMPQNEIDAFTLALYNFYGYPYPNKKFDILRIWNPYTPASPTPLKGDIAASKEESWKTADFYQWGDEGTGQPKDQCKYTYYGYIRANANGVIQIVRDGVAQPMGNAIPAASTLPAVRYILPYPKTAIQRSAGAYKNYYGYK